MTTTMTDLQTGKTFVFNDALPGRDAYEEALALGFEGSREEWIASLRGLDFDPEAPTWENDRIYPPRAAVIHSNSFWFARVTNQTVEPGSDDAVWMKLVHGEDATTLSDAIDTLNAIRDEANDIANAPEDEELEPGEFSANHHRLKTAALVGQAAALKQGGEQVLAQTIEASENLTPICALHNLEFPIPSGWWDTLDRLPAVTSLLSSTSTYAIICNWNPVSLVAGVEGSVPSLDEAFTDMAGTIGATPDSSVARINDTGPNERHTVQSNAALRPKLGAAPVVVRNLLQNTENITTSTWSHLTNLIETETGFDGPEGKPNATRLRAIEGDGTHRIGVQNLEEVRKVLSIFAKADSSDFLRIWSFPGTEAGRNMFDVRNGLVELDSSNAKIEDVGGGWFRCSAEVHPTAVNLAVGPAKSATETGSSYIADGTESVFVTQAQLEVGTEVTPYQRVGASRLDITEAAFPSPRFIRFDLSDDVLPTNFTNGFTGDVLVFGRKGSWVERDLTIAAGGNLNIGPQTFTGAPAGMLPALGDIVGWTAVDRTLDEDEIARAVAYHRQKGAKGLLVPGPELSGQIENLDIAPWVKLAGATISGNEVTCPVVFSGVRQTIAVMAGSYALDMEVERVSGISSISLDFTSNSPANPFAYRNIFIAGSETITRIHPVLTFSAAGNTPFDISTRQSSPDVTFRLTRFSLRRLIPQEQLV